MPKTLTKFKKPKGLSIYSNQPVAPVSGGRQ